MNKKPKCPEMIGYVGDVRNLAEDHGGAVSEKKIIAWVKRSTSVNYAILFYSKDDVYHVGKMRSRLLQINPSLRFKQISDIQEFIDYIDTGMDRTQHPVQDIEMIHIYSTWDKQGEVDYVEEARKRHAPEVRQVSREAMKELFEGMVINIFLSNKEANRTKALTDSEVYQRIKDEYGWDQASAVKDEILNISGIAKNGADELRDKRELLTKGIKGLPDVKPQSLLVRGLKYVGPVGALIDANEKLEGIDNAQKKADAQQKIIDQCFENEKKKFVSDFKRCIDLQQGALINLTEDLYKAAGLEAFSPQNIQKIRNLKNHAK